MTEAILDVEWLAFRKTLEAELGVPLHQYKEPQMKRRLGTFMARCRFDSWTAFQEGVRSDGALLAEVRDMLTINVSEFYRQPERFADLQTRILPELLRSRRPLKIWSAGCSIGCEPYTLSMILDQLDPGGRHTILATDLDSGALERARTGQGYLPHEVRSVPAPVLAEYFEQDGDGTFRVAERVKRGVVFRQHDLLSDTYPRNVDLILCRNVVIYFTEPAKQQIYAGFARSLRPGGYLFIGGSEMIMRSKEAGFHVSGTSVYRKAA